MLFVVEPVPARNETTSSPKPYEDIPSLLARINKPQGGNNTVNTAAKGPAALPAALPLVVTPKPVQDIFSKDPSTYLDLYADAKEEEWNKAQCKGANFVRAMRSSDSEAGKIFKPPRDTAAGLFSEKDTGK